MITHQQLVRRACQWLLNKRKLRVVIAEPTAVSEHPDAIGFKGTHSELVECKTTRADLLRDRKKPARRMRAMSMGGRRWMMMPLDLAENCGDVMADHFQGWGLLGVWRGVKSVRVLAEPVVTTTRRAVWYEMAVLEHEVSKHRDPRYEYLPDEHRFRWLGAGWD